MKNTKEQLKKAQQERLLKILVSEHPELKLIQARGNLCAFQGANNKIRCFDYDVECEMWIELQEHKS